MGYIQGQWTPTKRRGPIAAEFTGPGPASITLPSLFGSTTRDATKSNSPSYTLNGRPRSKLDTVGPGPAVYDLTGVTHQGKVHPGGTILSGRLKEPANFVTPSPADYLPEKGDDSVHEVSPKFSFGVKVKDPKPEDIPAPNQYTVGVDETAPKYTFGLKVKDPKLADIPAPNAYTVNLPKCAPKYTFGNRAKESKPDNIPAPNTYKIPALMGSVVTEGGKRQSPAYTLSGRTKQPALPKYPGPGQYNSVDSDVIKKKSPRITVSTRYDLPCDKTNVPGPGAFSPEKVTEALDGTPRYSFGIRHSQYSSSIADKKGKNL